MAKQFDALWDSLPPDARLTLLYQHFREQETRLTDLEGTVGDTQATLGTIQGGLAPITHSFPDLMKWVEESREEREKRKELEQKGDHRASILLTTSLATFPVIVGLCLVVRDTYPTLAIGGIGAAAAVLLMIVGMAVARA